MKNRWIKIIFFSTAIMLSGNTMADILVPDKVYSHDPDFLASSNIKMPNTKDEFYSLIKLADDGNSEANWMVSVIYQQSGNNVEAEKYYQRSIDRQDDYMGPSAVNLGYMYDKNNNIKKAMELFHQAGDAGYYGGYQAVGTEYFLGRDIPLDFEKARFYYKKAAELGCYECQYYIDNWDGVVKIKMKDLKIEK
ncbi:type IV pilus biogenesis/stability protein PilW [Proteus vulgaris]|nr:type IV pilus biogenesis/stability protein PilW [Proteus vulgaris]